MNCNMASIAENINSLKKQVPENVQLIAVSKTKAPALLLEAYASGQRLFGENYVQELTEKHAVLPADIEWHFIGHLQSNKVKYIAPFVHWIHGVDSLRLLREISKQASKHNRIIHCMLQVHIASEESKFGFSADEIRQECSLFDASEFPNIALCGLMGMASFTTDVAVIRSEFNHLKTLFDELQHGPFQHVRTFTALSMGMSSDWPIAVEEGSTMIRVGSAIFGTRN